MDVERATKITAARRQIEELENSKPAESGNEHLSPDQRFDKLYRRIQNMKGGSPVGWESDTTTAAGLTARMTTEDGSELTLLLVTFGGDRRGGGPIVRGVRADWSGDGVEIGNSEYVSNEPFLPKSNEDADQALLDKLASLEEAAAAAEFMIAATAEAEAAQTEAISPDIEVRLA